MSLSDVKAEITDYTFRGPLPPDDRRRGMFNNLRRHADVGDGVFAVYFTPVSRRRGTFLDITTEGEALEFIRSGMSAISPAPPNLSHRSIDNVFSYLREYPNDGPQPNSIVWVSVRIGTSSEAINNEYSSAISIRFTRWSELDTDRIMTQLARKIQSAKDSDRYTITGMEVLWTKPPPSGGNGVVSFSIEDTNGKFMRLNPPDWGEGDYSCAVRCFVILLKYHAFEIKKRLGVNTKEDMKHWKMWLRWFKTIPTPNSKQKGFTQMKQAVSILAEESNVDLSTPTTLEEIQRMTDVMSSRLSTPCATMVYDWNQSARVILDTSSDDEHLNPFHTEHKHLTPDDEKQQQQQQQHPDETQLMNNHRDYIYFFLILKDNHYIAAKKIHRLLGMPYWCDRCKRGLHKHPSKHHCQKKCYYCNSSDDHKNQRVAAIAYNQQNQTLLNFTPKEIPQLITCPDCNHNFVGDECFAYHKKKGWCGFRWKCTDCSLSFIDNPKKKGVYYRSREDHICGEFYCKNCGQFDDASKHECYMKSIVPKNFNEKYLFADFECTQDKSDNYQHKVVMACTADYEGKFWPTHYTIGEWVDYLLTNDYGGYTVIFHNGKGYDFQFIMAELMTPTSTNASCRQNVCILDPVLQGTKILTMTIKTGRKKIRFVDSLNFIPMPLSKFASTFGLKVQKGEFPHLFNTSENWTYVGNMPDISYYPEKCQTSPEFIHWHTIQRRKHRNRWCMRDEMLKYCRADVDVLRLGCISFRSMVMRITHNQHDPFCKVTLAGSALDIFRLLFIQKDSKQREEGKVRIASLSRTLTAKLLPAFCGGRTGPTKLYYKCGPESKIRYVDKTSLYPYINKNASVPSGHPLYYDFKLNEADKKQLPKLVRSLSPLVTDDHSLSIWKVDVECPDSLYHPVLPQKKNGRLMFDLTPKYYAMFTNIELRKALSLGYKITTYHECWYWPPERTTRGLFREYVNMWLKIKQEAAGFTPRPDFTLDQYVARYYKDEGIQLNKNDIHTKKNNGLYKLSKLYLNSLWGKFAQRLPEKYTSCAIIQAGIDTKRWYKMLSKDQVNSVRIINEHTILANYTNVNLYKSIKSRHGRHQFLQERIGDSNIAVAIFTTSAARLNLYQSIERLGDRVCYYDTDSIVFLHTIHENPQLLAPLGRKLGDLTSELGHDPYRYENKQETTPYITEFVSTGPKSYAYRTSNDKMCVKIKGINCRSFRSVGQYLNFDAMKMVVLSNCSFTVQNMIFKRNRHHQVFTNHSAAKVLRNVFVKRKVKPLKYVPDEQMMIDTNITKRSNEWVIRPGDECVNTTPFTNDTAEELQRDGLVSIMRKKQNSPCWFISYNEQKKAIRIQKSKDGKLKEMMKEGYVMILRCDGFNSHQELDSFDQAMKSLMSNDNHTTTISTVIMRFFQTMTNIKQSVLHSGGDPYCVIVNEKPFASMMVMGHINIRRLITHSPDYQVMFSSLYEPNTSSTVYRPHLMKYTDKSQAYKEYSIEMKYNESVETEILLSAPLQELEYECHFPPQPKNKKRRTTPPLPTTPEPTPDSTTQWLYRDDDLTPMPPTDYDAIDALVNYEELNANEDYRTAFQSDTEQ